ncbi:hypothetical protein GCM10011490_05040 [Pseudoclavibacter endophyticus]|uniref:Uncharacterized protein n=1 Tax=Pseudoclavibacter endophyticus TaxID=1778590 RepID=A0A6H9WGA6_9MICO|nr:hypothetical protein [Pseudoclavibacter endophyticus]KAB1649989.1 hypothetical protein F8O04_07175 [Pseudoclavibacter endophyticus]GGA58142.1 hypothetical protein GCM10011490_05040 [Pseudoclavibacter endophyticus]
MTVRDADGVRSVVVSWRVPAGRPDWLMGTGATAVERGLVWAGALAGLGVVALVAVAQGTQWSWWQWVLVAVVVLDVVGGVTANALGSAKRFYHSAPPADAGLLRRLLHHPVGFTAAHLHPFLLAALLPGGTWAWATGWYLGCLLSVVVVSRVPTYLARPAAFTLVTLLVLAAPLLAAPDGMDWFGPVLALKLVLSHALREEPYRPDADS